MRIINLLPKYEKEAYRKLRILSHLREFTLWSFVTYVVVLAILIGTHFYIQKNLFNIDNDIALEKQIIAKADNAAIKSQLDFNNGSVADYNQLAQTNPTWSRVLEGFSNLVPQGVAIKEFSANLADGKIQINGTAQTRDAVLVLRQNIIASSLFQNIDFPLDNLQKPTNTSFHYTFFLKTGVLKP